MKDIPIMMSAPMVLACLREIERPGTGKRETRRLAWAKRLRIRQGEEGGLLPSPWQKIKPGDRLWVRENFFAYGRWVGSKKAGKVTYQFLRCQKPGDNLIFAADFDNGHPLPMGQFGSYDPAWHLRPNIFLPREESRLTLIVTATKIEPLQRISEEDAVAEGVEHDEEHPTLFKLYHPLPGNAPGLMVSGFARISYRSLWMSLHGPDAWDANPHVVAISFRPVLANIDAPEARAA